MTITLPAEQDSILSRLVQLGRFRSPQEAVSEAVIRLERQLNHDDIIPSPLTDDEAAEVYGEDAEWEKVELSMAGRATPEV
jgi:Arc/MetJ-type ribon-helix-helix transcriptional regulator